MIRDVVIKVDPSMIDAADYLRDRVHRQHKPEDGELKAHRLLKKSIDARKQAHYVLRYRLYIDEMPESYQSHRDQYRNVRDAEAVHIIGAGPAGYFAALQCLKLGLKPIIYDRGKDVRQRRRDLRAVQQDGIVNPDSNYCFGEGGAGTYSDGKLYTRSHKRGPVRDVLEILAEHGAKEDILTDAHPHIGSNKLPQIVSAIRETIEHHGGEVYFDHRLIDWEENDGKLGLKFADRKQIIWAKALILATGHSARDIYTILHRKGLSLEAKDFSLGVRIEHPQPAIDRIQYRRQQRGDLPAARYSLSCRVDDRAVYSFCMCPGGLIVPTSTEPGELVINGMSLSRRDSPYANSGMVVEIPVDSLPESCGDDALKTMRYQKQIEQHMWSLGSGSQAAPAQNLMDFIEGRDTIQLGPSSYIPGLYPCRLDLELPQEVSHRLREGFLIFGKKLRGFLHPKAQIIAVESRTSAPVRIPRDPESLRHPDLPALYPCAEGAGYAGGIMSAALDGMRVAQRIAVAMDA